jgi:hypothetical protein
MPNKVTIDAMTGGRNITPLEGAELVAFEAALEAEPVRVAEFEKVTANRATLQQRAQAALTANGTYLGLANPTTGEAVAQVARLTRECSALIRLLLDALDDVAGT